MGIDLEGIIEKATQMAKRATEEDAAGNLEVAEQAYIAASDWLLHATKYGHLDANMKKNLRTKLTSYVARAEEIRKTLNAQNPQAEKSSPIAAAGPSKGGKNDKKTTKAEDEDRAHFIQKMEEKIITNPDVSFDDVVGLDEAKVALREAVILPVKYPKLFRGKRKPWSGILLYGPPGTGKSYLAKAVATECKSTFISISSADILSKWVGDSEKGVRYLFDLARERQPCIIFIDEIDALCGSRNDSTSESSRRVLNQFLIEMQGVGTNNTGVLVLAATNIPWDLDMGIRRRYEKRIYIPLPGVIERAAMFKAHLGTETIHNIKEHEWMQLAERAENYSGADVASVCREALLRPIRRLVTATHFKKVPNPEAEGPRELWLACSPGDAGAKSMVLNQIEADDLAEPPVIMSDMLAALSTQRASVASTDLEKYVKYTEQFGQDGS